MVSAHRPHAFVKMPLLAALLALLPLAAPAADPAPTAAARAFLKTVPLPPPVFDGALAVEHALALRRSVRTFADRPLTLAEAGQLLWAAYGVTKPIPESERPALRGGLRTAPSAGALFPLEVYLVAGRVEGLPAGVYLYDSARHALGLLRAGDVRAALAEVSLSQTMIADAPASLVWSAVFARNTAKYGERGRERYVCMDLGHSGENVYLQAEALRLGTCAVGAFEDLAVKQVIGMTKEEEPLYVMPVGHPRKDAK